METTLLLPALARWAMLDHVLKCLPEEGCGIIGGLPGEARHVIPVTNQLHSSTRFFMQPYELIQAFHQLDQAEIELTAIFHSHPAGPDHPSQTDVREFYYPGVISLIWSPRAGDWQVRGYWIDKGKFSSVQLREEA